MRKLTALDAMFLYNETPATPMHVAGLQYLEVDADRKETFFDDLKRLLLERIHLVPYLTSRIEPAPMHIDHPVWVRHQGFDIDQHLHRVRVDAPGTVPQVEALAARLYEPLMDRSKPLWEMWVIEGLANGQVALLQKTHHAAIDGASSLKAAELIMDFTPEPRAVEPAPADFWDVETPTYAELLQAALANLNRYWWEGVQRLPGLVRAGNRAARRLASQEERPALLAPKTVINGSIDGRRAFAQVEMSLSEVKAIAKQAGVKVNDVVLAICGEGLARYAARRGQAVDGSLIASCPVSLHQPGDTTIGNQVSSINVAMHNNVADARERLAAIGRSSRAAKEALADVRDVVPTDFGLFGLPALMQSFAQFAGNGLLADLATQLPMNLVVSNVPGFQVPLYVAGARLVSQMPMSIVVHGSAVNLTVTSYLDRLDLGITAAAQRIPDVANLKADLEAAYRWLADASVGEVQADVPLAA